ncbi:hypothetical protein OsJ_07854 [Oryza sativa Japonica Group]|uniref:Uncharacterized protein n=1 Tax=Oryza sativa subsp. japonica TaxID=39947 RepID=A3A9X5_ORYSJ|nr:hypothetical protein OsJ_07854 [Oryza sativa Japonica Group]
MAMSMAMSRALAARHRSHLGHRIEVKSHHASPPRLPLLPRSPGLTLASRPRMLPARPRMSSSESDLSPTPPSERTMTAWDLASLWVGLVVGVPSYYLAGSLVDLGMSALQGVATVAFANLVVLVSLVLTAAPAVTHGLPFPVLARAAFGVRGAHLPAVIRALVGCGWFGIESWIGGRAVFLLLPSRLKSYQPLLAPVPGLGAAPLEFACFLAFWAAQLGVIMHGMEGIRKLENFWATVAINIPDFARYARSQADQVLGQAGLPVFMGMFTFAGLAVTSATEAIFGHVISDPIELLGRIGGPVTTVLAIVGISLATITTNIAANVVAPANALVSMSPRKFTFAKGALVTALLGIAFQPWRLLSSSESFVYTWLLGYSALMGPIGGIILADHYIVRRTALDVDALYSEDSHGPYYFQGGFNVAAMAAMAAGVAPIVPGFLHNVGVLPSVSKAFETAYNNAWFVSFFVAGAVYCLLCRRNRNELKHQHD